MYANQSLRWQGPQTVLIELDLLPSIVFMIEFLQNLNMCVCSSFTQRDSAP